MCHRAQFVWCQAWHPGPRASEASTQPVEPQPSLSLFFHLRDHVKCGKCSLAVVLGPHDLPLCLLYHCTICIVSLSQTDTQAADLFSFPFKFNKRNVPISQSIPNYRLTRACWLKEHPRLEANWPVLTTEPANNLPQFTRENPYVTNGWDLANEGGAVAWSTHPGTLSINSRWALPCL